MLKTIFLKEKKLVFTKCSNMHNFSNKIVIIIIQSFVAILQNFAKFIKPQLFYTAIIN